MSTACIVDHVTCQPKVCAQPVHFGERHVYAGNPSLACQLIMRTAKQSNH